LDFKIIRAPCRSSISATGHNDTEVSNAARATIKFPARANTSWPPVSSRTTLNVSFAPFGHGPVLAGFDPPWLDLNFTVAGFAICINVTVIGFWIGAVADNTGAH
jgi:hypothetical protein